MSPLPRILVADASRTVRAALIQQLQPHYEVMEAADGESAWHALVLDGGICAVLSGRDMARMSGEALLARLRASKLRRLRELPLLMVCADIDDALHARLQSAGVSGVLTLPLARDGAPMAVAAVLEKDDAPASDGRDAWFEDPVSGIFTARYLELQAAQAMAQAARHDAPVSVLLIGFDALPDLTARYGEPAVRRLVGRFAGVLAARMRQEDSFGHYGSDCFGIVAPGTSARACVAFAERVREAVLASHAALQGDDVVLTVSIGIAGFPDDAGASLVSASELFDLARQRMLTAQGAGGNRVCSGLGLDASPGSGMSVSEALRLLALGQDAPVRAALPAIGQRLMPLLSLMEEEAGVSLSLAALATIFEDRMKNTTDSGQFRCVQENQVEKGNI